MLSAMRLLAGLAGLGATLAKPVDFVSTSYPTPSTTPEIPTAIAASDSEIHIAERTVSIASGGGSTAPGWTFISCFTDEMDARALLTQVRITGGPDTMSVSQCNYACWVEGFILSGVEFAHECWCDHTLNGKYHLKVPASECNMVCTGENTETCGGANRIAIYEYSSTPALVSGTPIFGPPTLAARSIDIMSLYSPLGCYEDSTVSRMLEKYANISGADKDMTIETCAKACYDSNNPYAGLEYGDECFCDTLMRTLVKASDSDCNMTCPGDSEAICGGDLRINIYSYKGPTALTATSTTASTTRATPTNSPITAPGAYEYKGCFSDVTYNRTLGFIGSFPGSHEGMTIGPCQGACKNAGYVFAGVEFGHECWCDNAIRGVGVPVADGDCNWACNGNNSETCGGSDRINIYSFAAAASTTAMTATYTISPPQSSQYFKSIGCYTDTRSNRTLGFVGDYSGAHGNLTIEPCQWACRNAHYMFAGVEFGDECWCDNVIRGIGLPTVDSDCNMPCYGNVSETCGGSDRLNIYQLVFAPTANASPSATASSTPVMPTLTIASSTTTSICTEYYVIALGDYCYNIWTSFGISQDQFATWNPSLTFPQCQIFVGQSVCIQQGPAGSTVVTIIALPTIATPTDELPAPASILATMTMRGSSIAVTPTTTSSASGRTFAVSASAVSCLTFYQVAKGNYCYEIWTSFAISQEQFTTLNPSLVFPQCQIFPGDFVCVQEGKGAVTTVTTLHAVSTSTISDGSFSTSTMKMTVLDTVTVMVVTTASSDSLAGAPSTVNSVSASISTPLTSETTFSIDRSKSGY